MITEVRARQVLDSRGNPTVEVEVVAGARGRAIVPSAPRPACTRRSSFATAGRVERQGCLHRGRERQRRDRGRRPGARRDGSGGLDRILIELDGTPNKGRLGANAILGVSLAAAKAAAAKAGVSLFRHLGGETATHPAGADDERDQRRRHADNSIDLQEFMVVPASADSFSEALQIGVETYHELKKLLAERGLSTLVGDEGGFAPTSSRARSRSRRSSTRPSARHRDRVGDRARSSVERVLLRRRLPLRGRETSRRRCRVLRRPRRPLPVVSLEDGDAEDDSKVWLATTERLGDRVQLVGDDIFVTNPARLQHRPRRRQLDPRQGRSDRHADRDDRGRQPSHANGYRAVMSTARARPRTRRSPTSAVALGTGQIRSRRRREERPRREVQPAAPHRGGAR